MLLVFFRAVAIFEASSSHACYSHGIWEKAKCNRNDEGDGKSLKFAAIPTQRLSGSETIYLRAVAIYIVALTWNLVRDNARINFLPKTSINGLAKAAKGQYCRIGVRNSNPFSSNSSDKYLCCYAKRFRQGLLVNLHKRANVYEASELFRLPISLSCQNSRLRANSSPRLLDDLINLAFVNVKILCSQAADWSRLQHVANDSRESNEFWIHCSINQNWFVFVGFVFR